MKRFWIPLFALLSLIVPLTAHAQKAGTGVVAWGWENLWFRHTSAASVAQKPWAFGGHGGGLTLGYVDSTVYRKGAATNALVDTSAAYRVEDWAMPPTYAARGGQWGGRAQQTALRSLGSSSFGSPGLIDSVIVDTTDATQWIAIRVRQDTLSYSFTGTTGFDSVGVAAQISYDGQNWFSVSGSPTRAFTSVALVSGEDGLQPPLMHGTESSPGVDAVQLNFQCQPTVFNVGTAFILNRTLCMAGAYVRFLISFQDGSGQVVAELGHWRNSNNPAEQ